MNKFLPLCAWQRHQNPLDHCHPLSFSAGWTTWTQLVNKQTPIGWHFAEKLTSKCEIAKTVWVYTYIFISKNSTHACGRLHTLTHASTHMGSEGEVWLMNCCSDELCSYTGLLPARNRISFQQKQGLCYSCPKGKYFVLPFLPGDWEAKFIKDCEINGYYKEE